MGTLQRSQDRGRGDGAGFERCGEPTDLVPLAGNESSVDLVAGQAIELPVIGLCVDAPEPVIGKVSEPWGEPIAEGPGEGEHDFGCAGGVG